MNQPSPAPQDASPHAPNRPNAGTHPDNRLSAAIVPASSRRGIAVSEALARGTGGTEFTPDPPESRCVGLDVNVEELLERGRPLGVFLQSNDHGDYRCEQLIVTSMSRQPQWRVPPFFPCQQALTGCATEIAWARCAANSAFIKTAT
jgi:hypothetical protein